MKDRIFIFPVVITPTSQTGTDYFVEIPDIDGMTQGSSVDNALNMARDYIGTYSLERELPASNFVVPDRKPNQIVSLVQVNIDWYRRKFEAPVVKKTLTIPYYLNEEAKEYDVNFSEVLTNALKAKLNH